MNADKTLVSQSEYARLCGVSKQAIFSIIKSGTLNLTGKKIDIDRFPPRKGRLEVGEAFVFEDYFLDIDYKELKGKKI